MKIDIENEVEIITNAIYEVFAKRKLNEVKSLEDYNNLPFYDYWSFRDYLTKENLINEYIEKHINEDGIGYSLLNFFYEGYEYIDMSCRDVLNIHAKEKNTNTSDLSINLSVVELAEVAAKLYIKKEIINNMHLIENDIKTDMAELRERYMN